MKNRDNDGGSTITNTTEESVPFLLTIPQAAEMMNISAAMVYKLIQTQKLPVVKLGRATRIRYAALDRWLQKREDRSI